MRAAIIGCGGIAQFHSRFLKEISGVQLVGVCDRDEYRAQSIATLGGGATVYTDFDKLLAEEKPDVVHVLTPPTSHAALAIQAMKAGCHVLVEKPMALSVREAGEMIEAARRNGVKLCVNHNYLFRPSILKARQLVEQGAIGDVLYVNSFYGISADEVPAYRGGDGRSHWAWRLPGGAFTNFLPHLVYLQMAFLPGVPAVAGVNMVKQTPDTAPTELSILLQSEKASGVMTFSGRTKPYVKFVEIYGTEGIIHADLVRESTVVHQYKRVPGMVAKVVFNLEASLQLASGTMANVLNVVSGRMTRMAGIRALVHTLYENLRASDEPPVPGEQGRQAIEIMEMIWKEAEARSFQFIATQQQKRCTGPRSIAERRIVDEQSLSGKALVTGATGFLGSHLAAALSRCGMEVIALARDPDRISPRLKQDAQVLYGDLRDPQAIFAAMQGVNYVFHCAAITTNKAPWKDHQDINIRGTEVVLQKALEAGVQRVVHVSSVMVYGIHGRTAKLVRETDPYEAKPDRWAYYLRSKVEADKIAFAYWQEKKLPVTVLRFGILYGPGGGRAPGVGFLQLGSTHLMIGNGRNHLPYTYIDNAVDAALMAAVSAEAIGKAFNVVDDPQVDLQRVIEKRRQITGENMRVVHIPPILLSGAARLLELRESWTGSTEPPKLSRFVIRSAHRDIQYDTAQTRLILGWRPEVPLEEGLQRTLKGVT